ncbi:MAG TPA: phosphopantetheine-binding protein [Polyangiaceae bacterium]
MVDHKSKEVFDDPPPSSTRRRDERVVEAICIILKTRFEIPPQEVHLTSRFIEDLGIDAFDLPDLILAMEEVFEIDIPTGHAARILTLKDAIRCVLALRARE